MIHDNEEIVWLQQHVWITAALAQWSAATPEPHEESEK